MKLTPFIILISALMFSTSCTTYVNKSQPSSSVNFVVDAPMEADVDVDMTRILKGQATEAEIIGIRLQTNHNYLDGVTYGGGEGAGGGFLGGFFSDGTIDRAKAGAAFNALKKEKDVDVLVAPRYVVQQKKVFFGFYKKVTVEVTAYAGKIKRIKDK